MSVKLLKALDAVDAALELAEQKAEDGSLTLDDIHTILDLVEEQGQIVHHLIDQPYVTHAQRVFVDRVYGAPQWSPVRPEKMIVQFGVMRKGLH